MTGIQVIITPLVNFEKVLGRVISRPKLRSIKLRPVDQGSSSVGHLLLAQAWVFTH